MGNENRKGRDPGANGQGEKARRRRAAAVLEFLESRTMLDGAAKFIPTSADVNDLSKGPLANAGGVLVSIYNEYNSFRAMSGGKFVSKWAGNIRFDPSGERVAVDVAGIGNPETFFASVAGAGMTIEATSTKMVVAEGLVPIAKLPQIAQLAQVATIRPVTVAFRDSQGSAVNQAEAALKADLAKAQFNVTGAGVKIGVISDSVNRFGNGLADSIATGDLPNNVQVLQDGPVGSSDEGRAMLEQIYDIAPGASLSFATGAGGPLAFANNIQALANNGANIIVDDLFYGGIPYFQDGIIAQAAANVVRNNNVIYVSSAGNAGTHGYETPANGFVTATIGGITGTFMNFNPGSGNSVTAMPITMTGDTVVEFQYDQPYNFTPNGAVTSNVDIIYLDASGNIVSSGTDDNTVTQAPEEFTLVPANAVSMAVRLVSGPTIGRVRWREFGTQSDFNVSTQFSTNPNVTFPTSFGHKVANEVIGTGAVPWFGAPPSPLATNPILNEDFSSHGPVNILFDANGNRLSAPQRRQKPDMSATDANNTSFFGAPAGSVPAGLPTNNYSLPNFYGTSSAAPNLAAVIALMKQLSPTSTRTDIVNALTSTATPLNGSAKGVWNKQGGFGLVDAQAALNVLDNLRVSTATPGSGATVTTNPGSITVTFSKPVNFSTVQASDLVITGPNGVTVRVGNPVAVDNPTTPTQIRFPYALTVPAGVSGNGTYRFSLATGSINATDGKSLVAYSDSFVIRDTIAPRVASTSLIGRTLKVTFTEPMNPLTITPSSIFVVRTNNPTRTFNDPNNQILNGYQGFKFSFDQATNTATLDFSDVNQALLPTDRYSLIVLPSVADSVGNTLDGEFTGTYPSGNGSNTGRDETFRIDYGVRTLTAPTISSLVLTNASDSGIKGDQNTNVNRPSFSGQVTANFPGTVKGVVILAQFSGLTHAGLPAGGLDLAMGDGGRGFKGTFDVQTTTDEFGRFTINFPVGVTLPDGYNKIRVIAIGQPDSPPLPGLSSSIDQSFRVDTTRPFVSGTSIANGANINGLLNLSLNVVDPISPTALNSPFAVPVQFAVSALDPASVANLSNYDLIDLGPDGIFGTSDDISRSSYIKSAAFTSTSNRTLTSSPYTGRIDLTFNGGLPGGKYLFIVHTRSGAIPGIVDSAGNAMGSATTNAIFGLTLNIQPVPTYITSYTAVSPNVRTPDPSDAVFTGIRSYYEVPGNNGDIRADAAPTQFVLDFSNSLAEGVDYTPLIQLVRTKGTAANAQYTGTFGNLGIDNQGGFTVVPGTTVQLADSVANAQPGKPGYKNRLIVSIAPGTTLEPDNYRLYLPNSGSSVIRDVFGNQLDGEFLGNNGPNGVGYETLLPNGKVRSGLSGDGVAGGAFVTGFTVVPHGNIIYARPDYFDDPFSSSDDPDGSLAKPYPVLAPQAVANALNGGDLNSAVNFGTGFDSRYDRSGKGRFDRSAFYAASQLSKNGPVVIVALAAPAQVNPVDGSVSQASFVLQAPSGSDPLVNDGSASVPFGTTLAMDAGSILKMRNATLFVQNQGSALQLNGTPTDPVTITSYLDDSVGGDTNRDGADSTARGGDFGGVVFRNYTQANRNSTFPVDGRLQGPTPTNSTTASDAITGADDVMSVVNFANVRFGGGAVPQTIGNRYDALMMFNSRPTISNATIADTGNGGLQASISVDVDSLREDDIARGPLIRRITNVRNSLNGIFVRAELNGVAEPTDAVVRPNNPTTKGGAKNYVMDDPVAYLFASRITIGAALAQETGGSQVSTRDRLYVAPGMILKFQRGAALEISNINASLIVGDRTYISRYDLDNTYGPTLANGQRNPNYVYNTIGDARAIFTSLYDDAATTSYFDPLTQTTTTIVPANPGVGTGSGSLQPSPGQPVPTQARWGSVTVQSGALAVIDEAEMRYGGGSVNTSTGTQSQRDVLAFVNANGGLGTRAFVTNNNFFDNLQAPISVEPNGLLAGDPTRPLVSGHPFFRGNLLQNNEINGLEVLAQGFSRTGSPFVVNQTVNALWDATDITYVLRDTIVLAGSTQNIFNPPVNGLAPIPNPAVTLSLQSALPDTILADGTQIARPGESLVVKLLNLTPGAPLGSGTAGMPNNNLNSKAQGGAGFLIGIDNGVDPTTDGLVDPGSFSQIRITGIGANETTGQARVPVVITSLRDNSVGTTVRGVTLNQATTTQFLSTLGYSGTSPLAGDGGVIGVGSLSYSDYNLYDPRDGSVIDNADIRYITRIEQQGGGIIALFDTNGDGSFDPVADGLFDQKSGIPTGNNTGTQYNVSKGFTISNSKLDSFSQAGLIAHPGVGNIIGIPQNYPGTVGRVGGLGLATQTFIYNTSLSNMPIGVRINSETADNTAFPSPPQAVLLNNTFFNVAEGVHTEAPGFNGQNSQSHVAMLAMNNIFANSSDVAIRTVGQSYSSQGQYNLFFNNNQDIDVVPSANNVFVNFQPIVGDPRFRNPSRLDFSLLPGSAAIDAARSELGPSIFGNMLSPASTQQLDATVGIRNTTGRANQRGGLGFATTLDYVALPGFTLRNFRDQFVPVLATAPGAIPSAISANQGTYYYAPIQGERDGAGYLRIDTSGTANVGFGSRPFFDIGAFEYRDLFPPHVTGVTATISGTSAAQSVNIYSIGGIAGTNQAPQNIQVSFDARIDPTTINASSVVLDASGGDGIFGNGNSPNDRTINLGGRLSFDSATKTLTINTANLFPAGSLNDVYRLRILGDGANVLRDPNGNALDGENLDASGNQRALPSGDSFPGGNFQVTFSISTNKPSIVSGSFTLDPTTDSNIRDTITNDSTPTFIGRITDTFPPTNFLQNQTVIIDISSRGDGNFDILNAGTGTTDANGNFAVTITNPIPDSPYNVGPSGVLAPGRGNTGYAIARVRVINQSGNPSNLTTDPLSSYVAAGATTGFVVDTVRPRVTSVNPPANASTGLTNGSVAITVGFDKNIDLNSLNANTIIVTRAGGDGIFGNANDVTLTLDTASIRPTLLFTPKGALSVTFNVGGNLANDLYRVVLKGTGTAVTDVAGNPLNGNAGGDYSSQFAVFSQSLSKIIYVGANTGTSPSGARNNPFPTITAGLAAATTGDTVAVLEGVYTENIRLKPQVRLVSAAASSTTTNVVPGNAQRTLIYGPNTSSVVVTAGDISAVQGLETEISGFSIVSAFAGDSVRGTIRSDSVGLAIGNSNILVNRNYFLNSGFGVAVTTSGPAAPTPRIVNNGFVGNLTGVLVNDTSRTTGVLQPTTIANNTIALNTDGIRVIALSQAPLLANIDNNIFWQNHELNTGRKGSAIFASTPDKALLRSNLFSGNSVSNTSPADDTYNIGNGFNPGALAATPDANGNFTGDPRFVAARDPRPNGDTPAVFFLDGNFDLTATSAAIDNARQASAPTTDFRYRTRVDIAGRGFAGKGPADVGAFEFNGTGGIAAGGAFRVATTSLAGDGAAAASGSTVTSTALSTAGSIVVNFSGSVNRSTVSPTDLILSGSGLNAVSPAKASSLSWIDDHTVRFNLSGGFNSTGTVKIEIPANAVLSSNGAGTLAYSDSVNLTPPTAPSNPTGGTAVLTDTVSNVTIKPATTPTASPTKVVTVKGTKKVANKATNGNKKAATPKPVTKTTAKPAKLGKVVINKKANG